MATFRIHEDANNVDENQKYKSKKVDLVQEVSRKRPINPRPALQTVNFIEQDSKRIKFSNQETNDSIRVVVIQTSQEEIEKKTVKDEKSALNLECIQLNPKNNLLKVKVKNEDEEKAWFSSDLLYATEYRQDIWCYLKELEKQYEWPKPTYMKKQKHIDSGMRCVLVDWLVAVSEEYMLNGETLHFAINYIDRFLSKMSVVKDKFQLLGSVAMMVAGKVEEIYPPDIKEFLYLSSDIYTNEQFIKMEQLLLKVLKFDMQPPTMASFIKLLCTEHKLDEKTKHLAMYLSELVLLEGEEYLQYLPSKLAAASVALARLTLSKKQAWPKKLEASSGYSLQQLSPVVKKQNISFKDSPSKTQQSIQTKYGSTKYHKVALLKPRCLNADFFADE